MNAILDIQVRVAAREAAAALKGVEAQIKQLQSSTVSGGTGSGWLTSFSGGLSGASAKLGEFSDRMIKSGKNMQWTGRQLEQNFTLPIVLAGAAAAKFEFDNEKAFAGVVKVYGNGTRVVKGELVELKKTFELLSDTFGKSQKDVIAIGRDWAEAGASGVALQNGVKLTLTAMALGSMEATTASQALITIQTAYGLQTKELTKTVEGLNEIAIRVPVTFQGLIQGTSRAGAIAKATGIDWRHLAALIASITPAAGSATQAGNAIKSILSRLAKPTNDMITAFGELGLTMHDLKRMNGAQQIEAIAKAMENYQKKNGNANRATFGAILAGTFQVNRFLALIDQVNAKNGLYVRSLDASKSSSKAHADSLKQLNTVLGTNAASFSILTQIMKNNLTKAIQPLLPVLITFMLQIVNLTQWFAHLSPQMQRVAIYGLLLLAAVGPLVRYYGAWKTLIGEVARGLKFGIDMFKGTIGIVGKVASSVWNMISKWILGDSLKISSTEKVVATEVTAAAEATAAWTDAAAESALAWTGAMGEIGAAAEEGELLAAQAAIGMSSVNAEAATISADSWEVFGEIGTTIFGELTAANTTAMGVIVGEEAAAAEASVLAWEVALGGIVTAMTAATVAAAAEATTMGGLWIASATVGIRAAAANELAWAESAAGSAVAWEVSATGIATALFELQAVTWAIATSMAIAMTTAAGESAAAWTLAAGEIALALGTGVGEGLAVVGEEVAVVTEEVTTEALGLWETFTAALGALWETITATIADFWWGLTSVIGEGIGFVIAGVQAAAAVIGDALAGAAAIIGLPIEAVVAIIAAVIAAILLLIQVLYKGGIVKFVKDTANALGQLPGIIATIFTNVVRVIAAAITIIIDWLSYLNPWSHHSPSLVENVTSGVTAILSQYARLNTIPALLSRAIGALKEFNTATAPGRAQIQASQRADERKSVAQFSPNALPQLNALYAAEDALQAKVQDLTDAIAAQQQVVDDWKVSLDAANESLKQDQLTLDQLKDSASKASDALNAAKDRLRDWAQTPIEGMRAMSDEIFANEQAQKKLRLEMMKMEDAVGPIQDVQDKLAKLAGDIEMARGQEADLRAAGAGSDVLSAWDDQIKQMEAAQSALQDASSGPASKLEEMQKQLDALQRQGEELDLTNSLQFDPLTRQIDQASNAMKEMPFDTIIAGIKAESAEVTRLQGVYDDATAAVANQQAIVDAATANRDKIQAQYDAEKKKLDDLKDAYSAVTDQIAAMDQAIQEFVSAADQANQKANAAQEALAAGVGGNIPPVGGNALLGHEGDLADMKKINDDLQKDLQKRLKEIGKLDLFSGLKEKWKEFKDGLGNGWDTIVRNVEAPFVGIGNWFETNVGGPIGDFWNKTLMPIFSGIGSWLGNNLGPAFSGLGGLVAGVWHGIGSVISGTWNVIHGIFSGIGGFITSYLIPIFQMLGAIVKIVFEVFIGIPIMFLWKQILWPFVQATMDFLGAELGPAFRAFGTVVGLVFQGVGQFAQILWGLLKIGFDDLMGYFHRDVAPVFDWLGQHIQDVFGVVGRFFARVWDDIKTGFANTVNFFARAFNTIAHGIEKIGSIVGIKVDIQDMPTNFGASSNSDAAGSNGGGGRQFAAGGILPADVTHGGVWNRARAVIGEGNPLHPEYVIPTDPKYRKRANQLWKQVGKHVGGGGSEREAGGPGLHTITDTISSVGHAFRKGAVMAAFAPFLAAANEIINLIPVDFVKGAANKIKNDVYNWAKGVDGQGSSGNIASSVGPTGILPPSGSTIARLEAYMDSTGIPHRVTSTYRPGDPGYHGLGRAVDFAGMEPGVDTDILGRIFHAFRPIESQLKELIYAGPQTNYNIKNGEHVGKYAQAEHHNHVHAAMAAGGLVRARAGGTLARLGEAGRDELVTPLPPGFINLLRTAAQMNTNTLNLANFHDKANQSGITITTPNGTSVATTAGSNGAVVNITMPEQKPETHLHFNGDLSFPNIKSGDDAETFIRNLEALAN